MLVQAKVLSSGIPPTNGQTNGLLEKVLREANEKIASR